MFPYKILNEMSAKLKNAEALLLQERNFYEAKIEKISNAYEEKLENIRCQKQLGSWCDCDKHPDLARQLFNRSDTKLPVPAFTQTVQTELVNDSKDTVNDVIEQLKEKVSSLVYENNRYHLQISNCQFCTADTWSSNDSLSLTDESIRASTPLVQHHDMNTVHSEPAEVVLSSSNILTEDGSRKTDTTEKRKDKAFITRMVKSLTKLEEKYRTPEHKRKRRLFLRKQRTSPIVPKELATIYHVLAAPEPEAVTVPDPIPYVRWNDVRFKPALPHPEQCPIHSCSPDPEFYVDRDDPTFQCNYNYAYGASQYGKPFGALPGYRTNLGVVPVPSTPVGGYVYCPDSAKWVLFAEPFSPPTAGRGTRRGGTPPARRRKG